MQRLKRVRRGDRVERADEKSDGVVGVCDVRVVLVQHREPLRGEVGVRLAPERDHNRDDGPDGKHRKPHAPRRPGQPRSCRHEGGEATERQGGEQTSGEAHDRVADWKTEWPRLTARDANLLADESERDVRHRRSEESRGSGEQQRNSRPAGCVEPRHRLNDQHSDGDARRPRCEHVSRCRTEQTCQCGDERCDERGTSRTVDGAHVSVLRVRHQHRGERREKVKRQSDQRLSEPYQRPTRDDRARSTERSGKCSRESPRLGSCGCAPAVA
mmetsp:Transcript_7649/g.34676  ORF Transcript_7649/g.34676 Transcript_7649/m.34676 type:complete len:271 (-) Transcript_7649:1335-2147(-)